MFVQTVAFIAVIVSQQQAVFPPPVHRLLSDPQKLRDLLPGQHADSTQSIVTTLQSIVFLNAVDYAAVETIGFARPQTATIQNVGDLLTGVTIEQPIDLLQYFGVGPELLPSIGRKG
jgi:hypothetical protein